MINAHLYDEVEKWWTAYYGANKGDPDKMKWKSIFKAFVDQFCTQRWVNKWTRDLEKHH